MAEIRVMVLASGLQRVMQALGAYGFVGHVKGKQDFLDHIPAGQEILMGILLEADREMPALMSELDGFQPSP